MLKVHISIVINSIVVRCSDKSGNTAFGILQLLPYCPIQLSYNSLFTNYLSLAVSKSILFRLFDVFITFGGNTGISKVTPLTSHDIPGNLDSTVIPA